MTTRRSFLAASSAAAAGAFISNRASAADVATIQLPAKWDAATDVLVAGSGIAGMSAAISALDKGAKVLVMEKGKNYGGCAIINGGIIALGGGTRTQKEHGVEDSPEQLYKKLTNPAHHEYARTRRNSSRSIPNGAPELRFGWKNTALNSFRHLHGPVSTTLSITSLTITFGGKTPEKADANRSRQADS